MKPALLLLLAPLPALADLAIEETDAAIEIRRNGVEVLRYHKEGVDVPRGVDQVFRRSGFIHPLATPSGQPLTGIHPADHYHHYGLFHAWVKTKHGKDEPDFWNVGDRTAHIRYRETVALKTPDGESPVAGFAVIQEHLAYKGEEREETVVLREKFTVGNAELGELNRFSYRVEQTNITDTALELPAYRYGGCLGWRGPHDWNDDNSRILTSEGRERDDSHTTRAEWIAFFGPTEAGRATFAVLIDPDNHDFPQRLRTWSSKDHHGAPFLSIVPTQEHDWEIGPGETIAMNYVILTADRELSAAEIERSWKQAFPR